MQVGTTVRSYLVDDDIHLTSSLVTDTSRDSEKDGTLFTSSAPLNGKILS